MFSQVVHHHLLTFHPPVVGLPRRLGKLTKCDSQAPFHIGLTEEFIPWSRQKSTGSGWNNGEFFFVLKKKT